MEKHLILKNKPVRPSGRFNSGSHLKTQLRDPKDWQTCAETRPAGYVHHLPQKLTVHRDIVNNKADWAVVNEHVIIVIHVEAKHRITLKQCQRGEAGTGDLWVQDQTGLHNQTALKPTNQTEANNYNHNHNHNNIQVGSRGQHATIDYTMETISTTQNVLSPTRTELNLILKITTES